MVLSLVPDDGGDVADINELRAILVEALARADRLELSMTGIHLDSAIAAIDTALAELNATKTNRDDDGRTGN